MGAHDFGTRKVQPGAKAQRERILLRDPICRCKGCKKCSPQGCARPSTDDDHIIAVSLGGSLETGQAFDHLHQGLCNPCHRVKSNTEALKARWKLRESRTPERHPGLK